MGVNIYAKVTPSKETLEKYSDRMQKAIMANKVNDIKRITSEFENKYGRIHVGKSSWGWQFLFAVNPSYYSISKESIMRFINRPDVTIFDEYGVQLSTETFWDEYVESSTDGYTSFNPPYGEETGSNQDGISFDGLWYTHADFS